MDRPGHEGILYVGSARDKGKTGEQKGCLFNGRLELCYSVPA